MVEFRHCINILISHTRDLTDEQVNILDPLRRAAGGDVGTTAGESSTAILGSHGGNDFQAEKWETTAHGRRRRSVSTTVQKEWSNKGQIMMFR